jgi:hypothetical protein
MDLFTVLEHEIGHLLGRKHDADGLSAQTPMAGTYRVAAPGADLRDVAASVGHAQAIPVRKGRRPQWGSLVTSKLTPLFIFVAFCGWAACGDLVKAGGKKVEPVNSWWGMLAEKKLADMAPARGCLTSRAAWKKL